MYYIISFLGVMTCAVIPEDTKSLHGTYVVTVEGGRRA